MPVVQQDALHYRNGNEVAMEKAFRHLYARAEAVTGIRKAIRKLMKIIRKGE